MIRSFGSRPYLTTLPALRTAAWKDNVRQSCRRWSRSPCRGSRASRQAGRGGHVGPRADPAQNAFHGARRRAQSNASSFVTVSTPFNRQVSKFFGMKPRRCPGSCAGPACRPRSPGIGGLDGNGLKRRVFRPDVAGHAGDRAARADPGHDRVDVPVRVLPNLLAGRLLVDRRVGRVVPNPDFGACWILPSGLTAITWMLIAVAATQRGTTDLARPIALAVRCESSVFKIRDHYRPGWRRRADRPHREAAFRACQTSH